MNQLTKTILISTAYHPPTKKNIFLNEFKTISNIMSPGKFCYGNVENSSCVKPKILILIWEKLSSRVYGII